MMLSVVYAKQIIEYILFLKIQRFNHLVCKAEYIPLPCSSKGLYLASEREAADKTNSEKKSLEETEKKIQSWMRPT